MVRTNLIYPVPTKEPAVAGIGCMITATYVISLESIDGNMGDLADDGNESGSRGLETTTENLGCVCRESAWP
jgi:hypothetical protein